LRNFSAKAGVKTDTSGNVMGLIWSKLIVNVGINALGTLLNVKKWPAHQGEA